MSTSAKAGREVAERGDDLLERRAEVLAPVRGDEHDPLPAERELGEPLGLQLHHVEKRVDHGVSRDGDLRVGDPFRQEVPPRSLGRRKVMVGDDGGDPAIHLFGIGIGLVSRPEPRLDVGNGHARVEGRERCRHGRGGVPLDQEQVRLLAGQIRRQLGEGAGRDLGEGLSLPHEVEVVIRADLEERENLIEHLAVLRGDADERADAGFLGEELQDRCHLDRLRAGAEDGEDGLAGSFGRVHADG